MSEDSNVVQGSQTPRERTPIFTELQLTNFKSIRDAVIPLHPLTVIVGANSSGKSTALQALLVLAQAARAEIGSGRLPLNGEYVQLGEFQDVQTFGVEPSAGISLGLSAEVISQRPRMRALRSLPDDQRAMLTWKGHFAQPADPRSGFASLDAMTMALSAIAGKPIFNLDIASVKEETAEQDEVRHEDPLAMMRGPLLKVDGRASGPQFEIVAVQRARFWGGVPERVYGEVSRLTHCARTWWDVWERKNEKELLELREDHRRGVGSFQKSPSKQSRLAAVKLATELIKASEFGSDLSSQIGHDFDYSRDGTLKQYFTDDLATHSPAARKKILISMTILREKGFIDELTNQLGSQYWLDQYLSLEIPGRLGDTIRDASSYFRGYLRTLRYLGPIREAPRAVYDPSPNRNDIGVRGEYAAAVLHARARETVTCPLPGSEGGSRRMSLGAALNLWLSEFGIASRAEAKDLGRLGMSLTVAPAGASRLIDLTSVGVGVSQVLPVILLCLLSRSASVILLEQPELHLHPAMQLKLADFLLACSRSGQQIIVETHSEHLVNRLRRRVANDSTKTLSHSIGLLFAEQKNGVSQYRATTISESGGLSQGWPEGFLDVGSNEATEFISEALRRRRQAAETPEPGKK